MRKICASPVPLHTSGQFLRIADHLSLSNPNSTGPDFSGCGRKCFTDYNLIWKDANFSEINLLLQKLELWLGRVFWASLCFAEALGHLASEPLERDVSAEDRAAVGLG